MTDAAKSVLIEAQTLVYGERAKAYGSAAENDARIAGMLKARFGWDVKPTDVWQIMVIVKLSREAVAPARDNRVDIAGYAEVGDQQHRDVPDNPLHRRYACAFCFEVFSGGPYHKCANGTVRKAGQIE